MLGTIKKTIKKAFPEPEPAKRRITDSDIEQVKTINLINYLESQGYKPQYNHGEKAMFFSPLREEKHPSFWVSRHNGYWSWKDWGTGEGGDIIKFVKLYHRVDFLDAMRMLLGEEYQSTHNKERRRSAEEPATKNVKAEWIKKFYRESLLLLDDDAHRNIKRYFESKGVRYYPSMGCICYNSFRDKKFYIGIPIPFPEKIRGLECREFRGKGRKTLGCKTLWVLKRDTSRVLVAESILDALAGEIVLHDDTITLCSINGVGNIGKVEKLVKQYGAKEVFFALDNDEPGEKAQGQGIKLVRPLTKVHIVDNHKEAGVKDLHKLLIAQKGSVAVASIFMLAAILYLLL